MGTRGKKGKAGKAAGANDDLDELLANINSSEPARTRKSKTVRCVCADTRCRSGAPSLTSSLGFRALRQRGRLCRRLRQQQALSMPRAHSLPRAGMQL